MVTGRDLRSLLQMRLPRNLDRLLRLPRAEKIDDGDPTITAAVLRRVVVLTGQWWIDLMRGALELPASMGTKNSSGAKAQRIGARDIWESTMLSIASYFSLALAALANKWPEALPPLKRYTATSKAADPADPERSMIRLLFAYYVLAMQGWTGMKWATSIPPAWIAPLSMAFVGINSIHTLASLARWTQTPATKALYSMLVDSSAKYAKAEVNPLRWVWETPSLYDRLRPGQLQLIASRSPKLLGRYGSRNVERIFEAQLALLMQSFGFYVVPARIGERRIDLLCIAPGPQQFCFLLDAKSSTKPYRLPVDDERALGEYVRTTKSRLTTLPAIRLVLLVGPSPAKTLTRRIRTFESNAGVPTRFVEAQLLDDLRGILPGPVPPFKWLDLLLASEPVVDADFGSQLASQAEQESEAHRQLVASMLGSADHLGRGKRRLGSLDVATGPKDRDTAIRRSR